LIDYPETDEELTKWLLMWAARDHYSHYQPWPVQADCYKYHECQIEYRHWIQKMHSYWPDLFEFKPNSKHSGVLETYSVKIMSVGVGTWYQSFVVNRLGYQL
tara:strand:- start:1066 stop:1371 length:306 start_codon:yes stop_codon:yes gene_type:complete